MSDTGPEAPSIRIDGGATASETAAIITVLASLRTVAAPPKPRRVWGSPAWTLGRLPMLTPGSWRTSALPRG